MTGNYDAIIIGAGHNGLTAAAYLAKAKKKVLVLERRAAVGGSVVTEDFGEGFQVDAIWTGGQLRPDILQDLKLGSFGWKPDPVKAAFVSLLPDSAPLIIDPDPVKAAQAIQYFSEKDAKRWPEFVRFMNQAAEFLDLAYATIMPRLGKRPEVSALKGLEDIYGLAELGLDLRWMGRADMLRLIRAIPMTAQEFLEEWFESEPLKAAIASVALHGMTLGVKSAGTGFTLIHNWLNRGGLSHANVGRAGEIAQALASAVNSNGGEILVSAEVDHVLIHALRATGVVLTNGQQFSAPLILSSADPQRSLLSLVGPMELPPEFVWKTRSIKMRGSVAKVHMQLAGNVLDIFPTQASQDPGASLPTWVIAPDLNYLEHAYDAAKYGQISDKPYLEITAGGNTLSVHFQFAPYALKAGDWNTARSQLEDLAITTLSQALPHLRSAITTVKSITPKDLEDVYGLTEGDVNHGQLLLDQFLFMRPMPGWSNHKTPIDGLYLCGSGVHAGGGVSGASGRNAARVVLSRRR